MSDIILVFFIIVAALALFIWNRFPAAAVAVGVSLTLFFAGILDANDAISGFGDPTVVFVAGLLVIAVGLEHAGVTTWAGQKLIERAGRSRTRLLTLIMVLAAALCALIGLNGTVAALLPVVLVVGVRLAIPASRLLIPLCFAIHSATMLTLLGTPVNVIASNAAAEAGYAPIGFFEFAVVGTPVLLGSMALILLFGRFLLPERAGAALPADLSAHAQTLVEQYRLDDGLHRFRIRPTSPLVAKVRSALSIDDYPGLSLVAVLDGATGAPLERATIAQDDVLLVRGDAAAAGRLAADMHLAVREPEGAAGSVANTLFSRASGLAEIVIPPRSKLIGERVFPGMVARGGDLMVLAVQRGGEDVGARPTALVAGDHLLLQGTWNGLDKHLADPQVLIVDSPEVVRRQAVPLAHRAWEAIGVLVLLVILLATGLVPPPIAALVCAGAMVLLGVLTISQVYKGIDWNTCILIGGIIPLATAMAKTGAADLIAEALVFLLGDAGPRALLGGLFLATAAVTQIMANPPAALVMLPVAVATANEIGASGLPFIIVTAMGASASLLTPIGTPVNLMVQEPGGYDFSDYWKLGLVLLLWWLVVALVIVPLYWRF